MNGAAAGIGCTLALAADFAIAGSSAYFLQPFAKIGLVPDAGASWLLPRFVGKARAAQMMMLGEKISAAQAEQWGMIYRAVPEQMLMDEALGLAARLAAGPTLAFGISRRNLWAALDANFAEALAAEAPGQRAAARSSDTREGRNSFIEKRAPLFTGN